MYMKKETHDATMKEQNKMIRSQIFLIDFDIQPPADWMKGYKELVPIILKHFNLEFQEMLIHKSKICRDCGRSRTDFPKNLKDYKNCMFCNSKKLKQGRGMHIFIKVKLEKILTPEEITKIQFLLLSDPHKELLGLKKAKKGLPYFNKLFSYVIFRKPPKKTCIDCKIRQNVMKLMGKF